MPFIHIVFFRFKDHLPGTVRDFRRSVPAADSPERTATRKQGDNVMAPAQREVAKAQAKRANAFGLHWTFSGAVERRERRRLIES